MLVEGHGAGRVRRPDRGVEPTLYLKRLVFPTLCAALLLGASPAGATAPTPAGTVPPEVSQAFERGLFRLPERPATTTSAAQTQWRVPIIMVSFTDDTLVYGAQDFSFALFDTTHSTATGSLYDYYQWVSRGRLKVQGTVVARVKLPHDRFYYAYNSWGLNTDSSPNNLWGAMRDALTRCDSLVKWSDFDMDHDGYVDMLWLLHAGVGGEAGRSRNDFWSLTSRMSGGWRYGGPYEMPELVPGSTTQHMRVDRFSTVPELSAFHPTERSEIGVYCHEFGHALGLPDLYDTSQLGGAANVGPGNWALMSTGAYGTNGYTPEQPAHMDAWSMLFLGWASAIDPTDDALLTLPPIEQGGSVVRFWFQGEPSAEHFLIENRQRLGFDQYLPSPGLLVYHIDESAIGSRLAANRINSGLTPGLEVVEADGDYDLYNGSNRGDSNDPFPGRTGRTSLTDETSPSTRTFSGAVTNIGLSQIATLGASMQFQIQVRAPGWLGVEDHSDATFNPSGITGVGTSAVTDTLGTLTAVGSESRAGVPQVVLRERRQGLWEPPITLSQSSLGADEPTVAQVPNGDLVVAWRDLRDGTSRLYCRTRIRGAWGAEQRIGNVPPNSFQPALGCDAHGWMYLAWLTAVNGRPRAMFMRFTYLSPFGTPVAITDSTAYPDAPTLAVGTDGRAYVMWPERSVYPQVVRFVRFHPDSGLSTSLPLGISDGASQVAVSAAVDGQGQLHAVLQEIGNGDASLHYQRRDFRTNSTWQRDTTIEVQPAGILSPSLVVDHLGGVHVVYETTVNGTQEIRYKQWSAGRGWDDISTEVTRASDGGSRQPRLVALSPGILCVLFTGYPAGTARFMSRDRRVGGVPLTDAGPAVAVSHLELELGPTPLRAGGTLQLRWIGAPGPADATVDLFDLAGRRLASIPLIGTGATRVARVGSSTTSSWAPGLYFARVRSSGATARLVVLR